MSMTLATSWVRRGVAAQFPTKYDVNEEELNRISKLARLQLEDAQQDLNAAQQEEDDSDSEEGAHTKSTKDSKGGSRNAEKDDDLAEYNLDDYDDEEQPDANGEKFAMFGNVKSLAYHAPGEKDPYLILPEGEKDSDDDREELQILPTDNLILAAKVEDEVAHLEVFVYEDDNDNLYVHHDIMLPAVPLCVEWIDFPVGENATNRSTGNFVAVGTMSPEIEVWDLDMIDSMYPSAILGQEPTEESLNETDGSKKNSKKTKKKPKTNDEYHVDAVLALAANRQHRNLLASASADKSVKLWDLTTGKCVKSYSMHSDKVCALDWHPTESTILLSGSYDRTVIATDMRAPDAEAPKWVVSADVERVRWDPHDPNFFYVTTEAGTVQYFDARTPPKSHDKPSKALWTLQAHDSAVSAFDVNPVVPGFLVTGSEDKRVKLWDVQNNKPNMVVSRNLDLGRVFSAQFAPDAEVAFRLSVAGSRGQVQIWDTSTNSNVRNVFAERVKLPEDTGKGDRMIGIAESDSESDDEDEAGGGMEVEGGGEGGPDGWESMEED